MPVKGEARACAEDEALAWFVALRDEGASEADRRRFSAWFEAETQNRDAWRGVEEIWTGLDRLPKPAASVSQDVATPLPTTLNAGAPWRWLALAAMVAALVLAGS